jgi:hypothetical protein
MVTITELPNRSWVPPNAKESKALYNLVCSSAPVLAKRPSGYETVAFSGFLGALHFIGSTMLRSDALNTGVSMSWFADEARHWLNQRGRPNRVEPGDIVMAALVLDVPHSFSPSRYPFDMNLGLKPGGGEGSFTNEWRKVLARGSLRPATPLPGTGGPAWAPGYVAGPHVQGPKW